MIHICNNFISSKVHLKLIEQMAKTEIQYVVVPVRKEEDVGVNQPDNKEIKVIYLKYNNILKFFPIIKALCISVLVIFSIFKRFGSDKASGNFILAHNLWSDGVPAFFCAVVFRTKYSLVVRNTDINIFLPKLFHARWFIALMIKKCAALIFISEAHKKRFLENWPKLFRCAVVVSVIPNGIEMFWRKRAFKVSRIGDRPNKIAYIGRFDKNKNIKNLFNAVVRINNRYPCELILIGGTEGQFRDVCKIRGELPVWVTIREWISEKEQLAEALSQCRVFAMPSYRETFGLVYIEALSCGCAILHSKNEGIDGVFDEDFVCRVDPYDVNDIAVQLDFLLNKFPYGLERRDVIRVTERFDWQKVSEKYMEVIR